MGDWRQERRQRTITYATRLLPGEAQRIQSAAQQLGITVSAYLRDTALQAAEEKRMAVVPALDCGPDGTRTR
jgi:hypothetical protein